MDKFTDRVDGWCPRCGEEFALWQSSTSSPIASSRCPHCGYDVMTDQMLYTEGVWAFTPDDGDLAEG